ncbi:alpha/beta fold hydrolase [Myxococcota bacterium]|nr:alpha/beta fold hydrolase [Myxococcota bacterium]MCZ7620533.1 alpha/beta hydrolase [Myxococcota bacterium]
MPLARVGSHALHYELLGDAPGTPLLLLAGLGGSARGWLALQAPEFAEHHRCILLDHRGVGASEDPGVPFSTADLADDAAALLGALGIERAHVLGAFLGGMVAHELALRHAGRVERLILVGSWARPDTKRRMLIEKWKAMSGHDLPLEVIAWERMLWTLSDETLEQTDLVQRMLAGFLHDGFPMSDDTFLRQCDACLGHDVTEHRDSAAHPALIVCGQQDGLTPPRLARELASTLPESHLVTIPNAAHLVMAEAAKRFNEIVLQFLAGEREA